MPRPYQIIPVNSFPTEEVYVNDNTVVTNSLVNVATNTVSFLYVVTSPKGIDGVVQTIMGQQDFVNKIGIGPYSLYGQSLLSAYSVAASGNAAVHVLRVADQMAPYANITVCARYTAEPGNIVIGGVNPLKIGFTAHVSDGALTKLDSLEDAYTPSSEPDEHGYTEVKLFTIAAKGRGKYGNNYQIMFSNSKTADKETGFKNYVLSLYEADKTLSQKESFRICFGENALVGDTSYYADAVINDPETGSKYINFVSFPESFQQIVDAYNLAVTTANEKAGDGAVLIPTQTVETFDFFGGMDINTGWPLGATYKGGVGAYVKSVIVDGTEVDPYGYDGYPDIALTGGHDGALDVSEDPAKRQAVIEELFKKAYAGELDPMIKSKNKFPTAIIPDCGFSQDIKNLIHDLNKKRGDSVALFDMGLTIKTQDSVLDAASNFVSYVDTYEAIDAYCGKIRDPFNKKIITVTSTYALCLMYAAHFMNFGGKHIPLADNDYGNLEDVFIPNTVYPVFDEDIHAEQMNELIEARINFARANARQEIKRATQTTRQDKLSMLSELHNVFILKDVKRAMEQLTATNRYNFAEPNDLVRFNTAAENVCAKFHGQVVSITAKYAQTQWEKEQSIIHLYVTIVNKNIVKTTIIEIDVNRE